MGYKIGILIEEEFEERRVGSQLPLMRSELVVELRSVRSAELVDAIDETMAMLSTKKEAALAAQAAEDLALFDDPEDEDS